MHGRQQAVADPSFEIELAESLKKSYGAAGLVELYGRFSTGDGFVDALMRRTIWRGLARRCGAGLQVGSGAGFKHPETFEIGKGVFIGAQAYIQGRFDGTCIIGDNVWIGPQAYFDARDLILEDFVGWGPGAKVLGSTHTAMPVDIPIVAHRPRDQAGADRGLGRHRHKRHDPARRDRRQRRDRRRRGGRDCGCRAVCRGRGRAGEIHALADRCRIGAPREG